MPRRGLRVSGQPPPFPSAVFFSCFRASQMWITTSPRLHFAVGCFVSGVFAQLADFFFSLHCVSLFSKWLPRWVAVLVSIYYLDKRRKGFLQLHCYAVMKKKKRAGLMPAIPARQLRCKNSVWSKKTKISTNTLKSTIT